MILPRITAWKWAVLLAGLTPVSLTAAVTASSQGGVVVSGSQESTEAGLEILRKGGSAADAAVTVSLMLGVTEPFNSGLGGKLIALYFDAKTGKTSFIDALGTAPSGISVKKLARMEPSSREKGYISACIPGCAAGLGLMHDRWGKLEWKSCVEPAATAAANGFELPAKQLVVFKDKLSLILADKEATRLYVPGGKLPAVGTRLTNPDLARTLRTMAAEGARAFYSGKIAQQLVDASKAGGGEFSMKDFARYEARLTEPLTADYKGNRIFTSPSPLTGGGILLLTLKSLEPHEWKNVGPSSIDRIDLCARVFRQVYPIISRSFADVPKAESDMPGIFKKATYDSVLSRAMDDDPARPSLAKNASESSDENLNGNTTHFIIVDREGNIACVSQSLSHHFGAGVVAPGTGVLLNNDLGNFGFNSPKAPNQIAPGKRPRSTMAPVIVTRDGKPVLALGSPASQRIPTGVYQVLSSVLDFNTPLAAAVDEPRFHLRQPVTSKARSNLLDLEKGIAATTVDGLTGRGWKTDAGTQDTYYFAAVNAVRIQPDGKREAIGDERRTNWAAGE